MYRYYVNLNINNQRMYNEDLIFVIDIDSDITYEFLDCYVEFVKGYNGIEN